MQFLQTQFPSSPNQNITKGAGDCTQSNSLLTSETRIRFWRRTKESDTGCA